MNVEGIVELAHAADEFICATMGDEATCSPIILSCRFVIIFQTTFDAP